MTRFIFLTTLFHTGTWFVLYFLHTHPKVDGILETRFLSVPNYLTGQKEWHTGVGGVEVPLEKGIVIEKFVPGGTNVLHSHFLNEAQPLTTGSILALMLMCPSVVTVRDPLRSVISACGGRIGAGKIRVEDEVSIMERVKDFQTLAACIDNISKVSAPVVSPIDLPVTVDSRYELLTKVLDHVGLPDDSHAKMWAEKWPLVNSRGGDYPFRDSYERRDVEFIKRAIPKTWNLLRSYERSLRPFLERHGYRNLMWWS